MRRQTLGRTTLLSFLCLKPITARKSPEWTLYSSSNDSTTALVDSSFPAALTSAASSTETLVAAPSTSPHSISTIPLVSQSDMPLVTASDSSFTVALPKPSEEPITMSALNQQSTTRSSSPSTSSSGGAAKAVSSAAAGSSRRKRASPKKKSGKRGGSSVPRSMEDEATMAYVRMGMMGALGATAGLAMI